MPRTNVEKLEAAGVFDFSEATTEQKDVVNYEFDSREIGMLISAKARTQSANANVPMGPCKITPNFF